MNSNKMKAKFLRALRKHKGLIATTARAANIGRTTHYKWYNEDKEYRDAVDEIMELEVEDVEGKLFNLISEENPTAIIFYLKSKSDKYKPSLKVDADVKGEITVNPITIVKPTTDNGEKTD